MEINNAPKLSVCIITYNQVDYISQCIESVLAQKIDFTWEIIIADDCSTDGTREVVVEYQQRYPELIKLILQRENVGAAQNWLDLMSAPSSEFVAYLEGDDYWIDSLKLKKQVSFLEANPDYALCFHKVKALANGMFIEEEILEGRFQKVNNKEKITDLDLLQNGNFIHAGSVVFRNIGIDFPFEFGYSPVGDYFHCLLLAEKGFLYRMDEYMGVYRRGSGIYSTLSHLDMQRKSMQFHIAILSYLSDDKKKRVFIKKAYESIDKFEKLLGDQKYQRTELAKSLSVKNLLGALLTKMVYLLSGRWL